MTDQEEDTIYDMQLRAAEVAASKPKFTPGPWHWGTVGDHRTLTNAFERIAIVWDYEGYVSDLLARDADEALIAAAPDLYAALNELVLNRWDVVNHYTRGQPFDHPLISAAFAALAKVDGREGSNG